MTPILRRYLGREILVATSFVFAAFLALFAFFDLIRELGDLGKGAYQIQHVLAVVLLSSPGHVYELFPIAVLIGTLYVLAHLAANSEYTVMRGAGLSPRDAAVALARVGAGFAVLTFLIGELVTPPAERAAHRVKLRATSSVVAQEFRTGLWVKDENRFVNVRSVMPDATLGDVRIYEFDADFRLATVSAARRGQYTGEGRWRLDDVVSTRFGRTEARVQRNPELDWQSVLTPDLLSVLFIMPERMSVWNLYQYVRHLSGNRQKTERYEIAMWKKLVYPFAVLVMMALALPFAYVHTRSGSVGVKVFSGIMLGIVFHMLNSLFSHIGLLQNWVPQISAVLPSLVFLAAAALMMWWVERR